ncbi:methyltransferase domain-containing protein [Porticoccaceae bacterium LTM1]|nr:methyltransferase domain-containing protein [Porticoccaceae bacterium LTM1]
MATSDRSFDGISEHFARKIYGGIKGQIRLDVLWRDISESLPDFLSKPRTVLDVGAGLGQIAIRLAKAGHRVEVNDISEEMLSLAQQTARESGVQGKIGWHHSPLQDLPTLLPHQFDLVMCHAVLEWLANPSEAIQVLDALVKEGGWLSLTFYNRDALVYRNLIRGNFNKAISNDFAGDPNSLTPPNPLTASEVERWLHQQGFEVMVKSGIRVFNDYVRDPRGGNSLPEAVREMELLHSNQEPFIGLGRYIHFLCRRKTP